MSGGGMGNVDPRVQRNPSTASPFGGSMVTARPEPINYEAPQPGQPYMGVGIQPMQPYGMQMPQPYGFPMPQPYGRPYKPMMPPCQPIESGQLDGPRGPMPDLQAQQSAQQAHDSYCQQNPMARGCEGMGSGVSAQLGSAVGPQIGSISNIGGNGPVSELFKQRYE